MTTTTDYTPPPLPPRRTAPPRQEPDWALGPIAIAEGRALPSFAAIEDVMPSLVDA